MEVTVESGAGLERRMRIRVPEEQISTQVNKRLESLSREARVPGFRPGKVPIKVIRQRFGRQVRDEVVGETLRASFFDALTREQLRPAGSPTIEPEKLEPGQGLSYLATFEVYPQIALPPLESLSIVRPTAQVEESDVETMLQTLQRQRRVWTEVQRAASERDRVLIDFEGFMDGAPLENANGKGVTAELDAQRMIPGFEAGLVGLSAGESKTLELSFPENYHAAELAGKAVSFEVTVQRVEEPSLPEIDDAFAASFGVSEGGAAALRQEVRRNMERELADRITNLTKRRTMDALSLNQDIELPAALVKEECQRALQRRRIELSHSGIDPEQAQLSEEMFEEQARMRVSLGLILSELIKEHALQPDPQKVRARIDTIASTYERPEEVVSWYYGERERLADIETAVLEEQVVDWVLERASVTEEATTFAALTQSGAPA